MKTWICILEYLSLRVIIDNCIKVHFNLILTHRLKGYQRPIFKSKFRETLKECSQAHIYFHRTFISYLQRKQGSRAR